MPLVSKTFSEIITFTRASSATYFDSAGLLTSATTNTPRLDYNPATLAAQGLLIEEQRVNLLTYSSEFDNAAWVKTGTVSVAANTVTSITGNVDADTLTTISGGANRVSQATTVAVSTSYAFSLFVKSGNINGITFRLFFSGGTSIDTYADFIFSSATFTNVIGAGAFTQQSIGNGWYRITCVLASGNNTAVDLRVGGLITTVQTGSTAYLYGAQLEAGAFATSYVPSVNTFTSRASTGSYFDSAGVLQSAAINVARNTYNPANLAAQPFLLLEEARTNSIRNNTMVGAVAGTPGTSPTNWNIAVSGTGITQQIVGTGTEDGITYIDVRFSGTGSGTAVPQIPTETSTQIVAATGQTWAASYYLRIVGGSTTGCIGTFQQIWQERDAAGVSLTTVGVFIADPTTAALRTQRSILTRTLTNAGTARLTNRIQWVFTDGVAVDITLRIGLPQLEQGAYATSVIPTSTVALTRAADISSSAQATRAADVASVNTLSPWYNASEGTLYAEAVYFALSAATSLASNQIRLFDGTGSNLITLRTVVGTGTPAADEVVADSGVTSMDTTGITITANTTYKRAIAYSTNNARAAINGAYTDPTDTAVTVPVVNALSFGFASGIYGLWLRRITYYPRRLSDAELQTLTT